jgi:hypothetical protein
MNLVATNGMGQQTTKGSGAVDRQSGGFQVSLLFIDRDAIEDEEEAAGFERSWEVRFHKR